MRITKFGHSCLLVEEGSARILIDPGCWSSVPENLKNLDAILITHEHGDHYDVPTIKKIMGENAGAVLYTNPGVGKKLEEVGVAYGVLKNGEATNVKSVSIEGVGEKHAIVYKTLPVWDNVGFFIAGRLFHPGDALTIPKVPVEILALPIAAPWANLTDTLDYCLAVKPKIAFAIHDGFLQASNPYYPHAEREFKAGGIEWKLLENDKLYDF